MLLVLFYIFAVIAIITSLLMVFTQNPIHSVLYLIATFFTIAGNYILLNAQFLAIVHIIVYAGAIMVLFLFVLMLLNLNEDAEPQNSSLIQTIAVITSGLLVVTLLGALRGSEQLQLPTQHDPNLGLVKNLGQKLFTDFVVPFEISSVLFLAAMVGAVLIGKRNSNAENATK